MYLVTAAEMQAHGPPDHRRLRPPRPGADGKRRPRGRRACSWRISPRPPAAGSALPPAAATTAATAM
ncbi:MAG: hypothetical protein MZV70_56925 [Desulfobacterales bacterium]|nr:hypothetical protein [Desulfobacterales bacterium]